VALLGAVVVRVDLRPQLDLFDDRLGLVLARLPGLQGGLVLELAVVHQLGDRGPGHGRNLDEVEICLLGQPERVINGNDPDLLAGRADKPHFGNPDALVDTRFGADVTSLCHQCFPRDHPWAQRRDLGLWTPRPREAAGDRKPKGPAILCRGATIAGTVSRKKPEATAYRDAATSRHALSERSGYTATGLTSEPLLANRQAARSGDLAYTRQR